MSGERPRLLYIDFGLVPAVGVSVTHRLSLLSAMLSDATIRCLTCLMFFFLISCELGNRDNRAP